MTQTQHRPTSKFAGLIRPSYFIAGLLLLAAMLAILGVTSRISTQPPASESVREELSRLQGSGGLTFAWVAETGARWSAEKVEGVNFQKRQVVPISGALGDFRPENDGQSRPQVQAIGKCWSHDQTKLAATFLESSTGKVSVQILGRQSQKMRAIAVNVSQAPFMTSQCWSEDDTKLVYAMDGAVRVYNLANDRADAIAKGSDPTWSPDGQWIAFRDGDNFYAVHPDGTGQRKVFRNHWGRAVSALYWSPDARIVAYVRELGFLQGGALDAEVNQLRARRLSDGSDESLCDDSVDWYANYRWIDSAELMNPGSH